MRPEDIDLRAKQIVEQYLSVVCSKGVLSSGITITDYLAARDQAIKEFPYISVSDSIEIGESEEAPRHKLAPRNDLPLQTKAEHKAYPERIETEDDLYATENAEIPLHTDDAMMDLLKNLPG